MQKRYNLDLERHSKSPQTEASTLKNVVSELVKTYQLEKKFTEVEIQEAWKSTLGDLVSKRTKKVYVKEEKLFVKLESASLKNELLMSKTQIIKDINEKIGQDLVKSLVFL